MKNSETTTAEIIGRLIGGLFVTYLVFYPVIYFAWNFAIEGIGFPQYQIPDFWVGMVLFLLFNLTKNTIKGVFK